jgi:hypothetical protein
VSAFLRKRTSIFSLFDQKFKIVSDLTSEIGKVDTSASQKYKNLDFSEVSSTINNKNFMEEYFSKNFKMAG